MMFFTDRNTAVQEMLRVLNRGGRMAVAVWDSLENHAAYHREVALLEEMAGPDAADALRAPFTMGATDRVAALFEGAGVESVSVTTRTGTARFPGVRSLVGADLRGWLPLMGVHLSEETIDGILAEAETALAEFVTPDGDVVFDSPAHVISGRKG